MSGVFALLGPGGWGGYGDWRKSLSSLSRSLTLHLTACGPPTLSQGHTVLSYAVTAVLLQEVPIPPTPCSSNGYKAGTRS